jgi:hypothetical protein
MDCTKEHLASSDAAIIQVRRRLIGAARALAEGKEPEAPWHPEAYAYHSARLVVDADILVAHFAHAQTAPQPQPLANLCGYTFSRVSIRKRISAAIV